MKNKLHLTLLAGIVCFAASFAQETTYYLPGTGTTVKALDFESTALLTEKFDYCAGWAGTGFGLSGTQRGAPEEVSVIANPEKVASSGNQVLAFRSYVRDAAWHAEHSSTCPAGSIYLGADNNNLGGGTQDDFFMYGQAWTASQTPSAMMHVFVPSSFENDGVTSLRMPISLTFQGQVYNDYPGIWCFGSFLYLRGPGRDDIGVQLNVPNDGLDMWWTIGISITPDGDIQYYATPSYVTSLTIEDYLGSNSALSAENNMDYFPVEAISTDGVAIMSSNVNMSLEPTLIDDMIYTKGTTQVLSIHDNEMFSIAMYPNPTSDYLFVKGLNSKTAFKIVDSLGRVIKTGAIGATTDNIDVNALAKGVYLLSLEGFNTRTFIKN